MDVETTKSKPALTVVPIYEANFRDIPKMLDLFAKEVGESGVKMVTTLCMCKGELDIRTMGDGDLAETLAIITAAQQMITSLLIAKLEEQSC